MHSERAALLKTGEKAAVSVVIATFNGARFIEEQLESLGAQTYTPHELIVSDDGSTDDTLALVARFRQRAPFPVVAYRNESRLGYGGNFLSAAKKASGDYIAFCDQDDVWFPNKLQRAMEVLEAERAELLVHTATLIDDAGNEIGSFTQGIREHRVFTPLQLAPWGVFYGFSMVFKREVLDLVDADRRGGHTFEFEGLLSHDLWIYFLCNSLGRIVTCDQPLAKYRQHNSNQTPHVQGSRFQSWKRSLGVSAHPQLRRDDIAAHRAALMLELSRSHSTEVASAAAKAATYWRRIAKHEASRIRFYTDRKMFGRVTGCAALALDGGYLAYRRGGLGWRLFVKDALVGVLDARRWRTNA